MAGVKETYWSNFAKDCERKQQELREMMDAVAASFEANDGLAEYVTEFDKTFVRKLREYRGDITFTRLAKVATIINNKP